VSPSGKVALEQKISGSLQQRIRRRPTLVTELTGGRSANVFATPTRCHGLTVTPQHDDTAHTRTGAGVASKVGMESLLMLCPASAQTNSTFSRATYRYGSAAHKACATNTISI
ncbi:hypothetical protein, partial [Xanthomonas albilineans]|uniref:hypothetical protein n=1 Tax=Xanthomonas albilineans TaxID=29447 RepID=UPI001F3BE22A